jgi:hypothetical protein
MKTAHKKLDLQSMERIRIELPIINFQRVGQASDWGRPTSRKFTGRLELDSRSRIFAA